MTSGWVGSMKLTIFMAPPQRGHCRGSTCQTLDQGGPSTAGLGGRWGPRGLGIVRWVAVGLGPQAAALIRVKAEVTSEVPSGFGDVLGELGDEVQRVEDLEVVVQVVGS